jgi:hypothetical protein
MSRPVDALLCVVAIAGIIGLGYALGLGWAGAAGPIIVIIGVIIGRLRLRTKRF